MDALARAGAEGTTLEAIGRAAGIAPALVASHLAGTDAVVTRRGDVISRDGLERLARGLPALVAAGARPEGIAASLVDEAEALLVGRGVLARDGNRLRVVDATRDAAAARDAVQQAARLAARLKREGLTPPDLPTLAPDAASRRIVEALVRRGIVVRATDKVQKRDWVFHADAVGEARARLAAALAGSREGLLVGEAGSVLGLTRRHSVPLLEHLDAVRFTRRVGDRRVLATD
jgi:selenocysteine-specific elongation factor